MLAEVSAQGSSSKRIGLDVGAGGSTSALKAGPSTVSSEIYFQAKATIATGQTEICQPSYFMEIPLQIVPDNLNPDLDFLSEGQKVASVISSALGLEGMVVVCKSEKKRVLIFLNADSAALNTIGSVNIALSGGSPYVVFWPSKCWVHQCAPMSKDLSEESPEKVIVLRVGKDTEQDPWSTMLWTMGKQNSEKLEARLNLGIVRQ